MSLKLLKLCEYQNLRSQRYLSIKNNIKFSSIYLKLLNLRIKLIKFKTILTQALMEDLNLHLNREQIQELSLKFQEIYQFLGQFDIEDLMRIQTNIKGSSHQYQTTDMQYLEFLHQQLLKRLEVSKILAKYALRMANITNSLYDRNQQLTQLINKSTQQSFSYKALYDQLKQESELDLKKCENKIETIEIQLRQIKTERKDIQEFYNQTFQNQSQYINKLQQTEKTLRNQLNNEQKQFQINLNTLRRQNLILQQEIIALKNQREYVEKSSHSIFVNLEKEGEPDHSFVAEQFLELEAESQSQQLQQIQQQPVLKKYNSSHSLTFDIDDIVEEDIENGEARLPSMKIIVEDKLSTKQSTVTEYFSIRKFPSTLLHRQKSMIIPEFKKKNKFGASSQINTLNNPQISFTQYQKPDSTFRKIHSFLHENIIEKKIRKFQKH